MNKKNKGYAFFIGIIFIVIIILIIFLLRVKNNKANNAPEFVFFYAENQPEDYPTSLGALYFSKLVEEKTEGRIKIIVKTGGELGVEKDIITQLSYGGIDFARVSLSQLAEKIPEMNILQMPYLYRDSDHMWKVLEGDIGEYFMNLTQTSDIVSLSWYDAGARNFYSTKPITNIDDVKGLKIRVQESNLMADMVTAIGGLPKKIEYDEVYSSLERGIVDAAENNWSSYIFMKHDEVANYITVDEHTRVPELQLCSLHTFNLLSDSDKEIIKECAKQSALYERELWKEQELTCYKKAVENGVTILQLNQQQKQEFQEAMKGVYEKYAGEDNEILNKIMKLK